MSAQTAPVPPLGTQQLELLLDDWRDDGTGSLAQRLAHVLRSRITSGLLAPGALLPPERSLAVALGISRSTVVAAFDDLRSAELVVTRQGSGTRVATSIEAPIDATGTTRQLLRGRGTINLAASVPYDSSHLPDLSVDIADLAAVHPAHGYAPAGLPSLREAIAARMTLGGLVTGPEQVQVTHGAQHALDLALAAVTRPGDVVAVEDPTYVGLLDALQGRGLRALPIPVDDVDEASSRLVRLCRGGRARAIALVPAVHSPTGRVRTPAVLAALAERLDSIGIPVIEDGTVADLAFRGGRPPTLAQLCTRAPVLTIESTSKVAWGGLRIGWLRADADTTVRSVDGRSTRDYGAAVPSQLLALGLLPRYDQLIADRRRALAPRARRLGRLLRQHLPDWRFTAPEGGLSLWVDTGIDAIALAEAALLHGVTVAPGATASRGASAATHLRLCFDRPDVELDAAVPALRRAVEDVRGWR